MKSKAQVTIFIIIAIVLVAAVAGYFVLRGKLTVGGLSADFKPVEASFIDCISNKAEQGKEILGQRAGYINLPAFEPGSNYAPFSNMLDFLGNDVPYWYYVSGNGQIGEQVSSKSNMENQLARYIQQEIRTCSFSEFEQRGFVITRGEPEVGVVINDYSIEVSVQENLEIEREGEKAVQSSHTVNLDSKLGKLYSEALSIYDEEKSVAFLENYGVDVLRLYAPVDGVEISCASKVWVPEKVVSDVKDALQVNVQAIKVKGNYYTSTENNKYFVVKEVSTNNAVNFIYSQNFPTRVEVWPVDSGIMKAEPVGNQEGLGMLGFCYVPYHFVYDLMYPVLVQVYDEKEMFQFPVAVVIDKNKPRQSEGSDALEQNVDICSYKNQDATVYTYDSKLNPVEADVGFKCFDTECDIGKTKISGGSAVLSDKFPQCVNGFVIARAPGYAEKKYMISTNELAVADIILDKLYNVSVEVELGGKEVGNAVIYFKGENYGTSLVWPLQKRVQLTEGSYNITMQVYTNSSLVFPASTSRKCVEVTKPGILGMFGQTEEQCFNINMPQQQLTSVLIGGGKGVDFFTEDRLDRGKIKISGEALTIPTSLEQVQQNYEIFETKHVFITDMD